LFVYLRLLIIKYKLKMATTDYNVNSDKIIINHIKPYLPKTYQVCDEMLNDGMFQRDRLVERALSETSNNLYKMDSGDNWDFTDYSDAKSASVNYRASQSRKHVHWGVIRIPSIKNKKSLRCLVYDPKRNSIRYFAIWQWGNKNIIEFSANPNGQSRYRNGICGIELNSFEELATYKFVLHNIKEFKNGTYINPDVKNHLEKNNFKIQEIYKDHNTFYNFLKTNAPQIVT